ncbi:bifunctional aspartate kinase/diaminopimelate decarboxylase [Xylella fastidiosa]|uniref:bifunctional aspartate kinase/diaminopimelate decarboxylase n=1 Tax=Xylella fastidiosa TaxID=2371 RepID=UPI000765FD41|nr:bifunctional aspartate kinase/diaminopimelate decarboxylase [Xylella fastidiosa]ALR01866.1 aspartate kinase [Xylella fastidiosa]KXB11672.1 diaminopimelate decarboxylase [Xylella fastidiosa]KXB21140.1 diaminopimelate decarboxylase [Xylella fastidiosa]MDG5822273.1 bifunctional aspartate kinase/diaminopimelate decarboxylase [Xylella fastidiosa subsp. pauca]MDG5825763.1 bifunctional aspartate kinase/diaminopimelate decarboxylase [Xylella fastidiosa subsp. pauca]
MSASPTAERWIVLKFGGTSVSRRHRWDTIAMVVRKRLEEHGTRVLIVVSALSGVTNELTAIAQGVVDSAQRVAALEQRHRDFLAELGLDAQAVLGTRFTVLWDLLQDARAVTRSLDWQAELLGQGELLSSTLGAAYLGASGVDIGWMDARDWLTALPPQPNQSEWSQRLSVSCQWKSDVEWRTRFDAQRAQVLITQGFISRHQDGGTAILGRGGSDTSAAYFGALLGAACVEIWTDVPGMFSANPKEVPDARLLTRLDYYEAQEIATTGAKVLHPRSIKPCRDTGVPMLILDTERPDVLGTRIDAEVEPVLGVKAISRRDGIVLVSMEGIGMWQQVGFLADVFTLFKKHGLSVDLIGSAETNVTVSLDPSENLVNTDVLTALSTDLSQICKVKIIVPCAAITLVGRGMRSLLHKLSEVWATFGKERVHMISQSSNDLNLTFVIDETDADGLLAVLHFKLIESGAMPVQERAVFGSPWREIIGHVRTRVMPWWHSARMRLLAMRDEEGIGPCYVYHLPTVRERARQLNAVVAVDQRYYAIKANPHPAILRTLIEEGFGLECVSLGELRHVFAVVPHLVPSRVLFTPSFASRVEYEQAFLLGVNVTLDNVEALRLWPEVFRDRTLWLRIDLGYGDGHHEKVTTGGKTSKFGLSVTRIDEFIDVAKTLNIIVTGLHAHLGSGVERGDHWSRMYDELAGFASRIGSVSTLDIGGGLPIPYRPDDEPFDVEAWGVSLAEVKALHPKLQLVIEPGRFLVAEAGVLLTRVTQVIEKDGIRRVGLEAGMHTLIRPALYDAWHDVENLSRLDEIPHVLCDVVGPICESSDVFGRCRHLPAATASGDLMLIADAGAYGFSMASTYNLRGLPAEVVLDA